MNELAGYKHDHVSTNWMGNSAPQAARSADSRNAHTRSEARCLAAFCCTRLVKMAKLPSRKSEGALRNELLRCPPHDKDGLHYPAHLPFARTFILNFLSGCPQFGMTVFELPALRLDLDATQARDQRTGANQ
jgi:hypothetical protein